MTHQKPRLIVVAGPNGSGKTSITQQLLMHQWMAGCIYVNPDFLSNAGGVTCSYFEQVQANMNFFWEKDEVLKRLDGIMTKAFHAMADMAERRGVFMRDAAYMIAVDRVAQAAKLRGRV